ncbi:glycosyltransferase involved in cell wall biosynthesis [Motilibacter peucedani]|uniref:Glycosyltransferase involved in cell wall biosynthesis n=1 Tax=Motilibacter peucedani TaxID=598650 RepID=A0A420XLB9_9ACTN|nr:glycosyltransferase family 4 protein [Motilibacter peucedani]RKS71305.1 glycosyltransferase involved in cell wall biosynthesis [Motilibacter peucedani]
MTGTGPARASMELVSRGDPLSPFLFRAVARHFDVVAELDPDLRRWQRYLVAATSFRPSRAAWAERFFKSLLARRLRTRNARTLHDRHGAEADVTLQVHALFAVEWARAAVYVDCTHRQVVEQWPAWNPLRGRALAEWHAEERATYARAQHLFAFYQATADSLVDDYGVDPARVSVVGAGANVAELPQVRTSAPVGPPEILFVGNDFERKGGQVLLEAFALVRRAHPDARLRLVGAGPRGDLGPGIEATGRVRDRAELARIYAGATVFCLPSLFDPFPLVVLEAMAHTLPVVATTVCGIPDMVVEGETGLLVKPHDAAGLADALCELLRDPVRAQQLGAAGRSRVESRFQWDHVVDRMLPALTRERLAGELSC